MAKLYGNTEGLQDALTLIQSKAAGGGSLPADNVTGSGTSGYLAKFNGANTITNGPPIGSSKTTYLCNDGNWRTPSRAPSLTKATSSYTAKRPVLMGYPTSTALRPSFTDSDGDAIFCDTLYAVPSTGALYAPSLTCTGDISANCFNANSDARLKENFETYVTEKSILDLPVYKYDYINGVKNQIGCKAQDLQVICPEIVHENEEGYLSIQESKIVYLLIDEIRKLKAEIAELRGK